MFKFSHVSSARRAKQALNELAGCCRVYRVSFRRSRCEKKRCEIVLRQVVFRVSSIESGAAKRCCGRLRRLKYCEWFVVLSLFEGFLRVMLTEQEPRLELLLLLLLR